MSLNPGSLGFITVPSPGTSVPLATVATPCKGIRIEPRRSLSVVNVGNVQIVSKGGANGTATTIYAVLSPEQVEGREIKPGDIGMLDASQWAVDADNANDGVLVGLLY